MILPMLLMIDNYDSFTFNLVHLFEAEGVEVVVVKNDEIGASDPLAKDATAVCFSPGPGRPQTAGNLLALIAELRGRKPMLGVCLGHQALAQAAGAQIVAARTIKHGKVSEVEHNSCDLFHELPNPLRVCRYHSLAVAAESVPEGLRVDATTWDGEIMGLSCPETRWWGVQFHPEAILSQCGVQLARNFLTIAHE